MQAEEGELRRCEGEEERALRSFMACYSSRSPEDLGLELLCSRSGGCTEAFVARKGLLEVGGGRAPFFAGVHAARICGGRVKPLLGLLNVLRGSVEGGYAVVEGKGAELFLYGRDALGESVAEVRPPRGGCRHYVVLDERGEPLGWAVRRGRVLRNELDLGWYLRSGL